MTAPDSVRRIAADVAKLARRYAEAAADNMSTTAASPAKIARELTDIARRLREVDK